MKKFILFILSISFINILAQIPSSEFNLTAFSGDGTGVYVTSNQYRTANDITVEPNVDFTLNTITANLVVDNGGSINSVDIVYYDDAGGKPGNQIGSQNAVIPTSQDLAYVSEFGLNIKSVVLDVTPFQFNGTINTSTTYWISIVATVSNSAIVWWELSEACTVGSRIAERNASSGIWHIKGYGDGVYSFDGTIEAISDIACDPTLANPETFEAVDLTDHCWTLYQTGTDDPGFVQTSSQSHNGSNSFYHASTDLSTSSSSYLVSPAISVEYFDYLSFWYYQHDIANYGASNILISTTSADPIADPSAFTKIMSLDETAVGGFSEDTWTKHSQSLNKYTGEVIYIAFEYIGDASHEFYIDDFSVLFEPLSYDEAATALHINVLAETTNCSPDTYITGSNIDATDSSVINGTPSCGSYASGDIWFKFEAPETGAVQLILTQYIMLGWSEFSYALYDAHDSSTELYCNVLGQYLNEMPTDQDYYDYITGLTPGKSYYLRAWDSNNNNFGEVEFCLLAYTDPNASVSNSTIDGFKAYPNPANNFVYFEAQDLIKNISVYNLLGKEIRNTTFDSKKIVFDIANFSSGTYIVKIKTSRQVTIYKLLVN